MVLLLENDDSSFSQIEVQCVLPDSTEEIFSICLPLLSSVNELFAILSDRISYPFDLWMSKDQKVSVFLIFSLLPDKSSPFIYTLPLDFRSMNLKGMIKV